MPPNATPTSAAFGGILVFVHLLDDVGADFLDRKSTRLNSSHVSSSYADFCLKKKTAGRGTPPRVRSSSLRRQRSTRGSPHPHHPARPSASLPYPPDSTSTGRAGSEGLPRPAL